MLPHYTHLLTLHAAQTTAEEERLTITIEDNHQGLQKTIRQLQQSIAIDHHRATMSAEKTLYRQVLLASALAETDPHGYFSADDVAAAMSMIMWQTRNVRSFSQHLNAFCDNRLGPALQRVGIPREYRYKFRNPILRPYVIMNGLETKLISEENMTQLAP